VTHQEIRQLRAYQATKPAPIPLEEAAIFVFSMRAVNGSDEHMITVMRHIWPLPEPEEPEESEDEDTMEFDSLLSPQILADVCRHETEWRVQTSAEDAGEE
jgi:hypothetical protein